MVRKMDKETMEATIKIISHKKRRKKIMMVVMVDLIMVIQSANLVSRMSRPNRKHSGKDEIPRERRGKLAKQLTEIP